MPIPKLNDEYSSLKYEQRKKLIGERIKLAREAASITQVQAARRLDVARQTYLDMESGKTEPRREMIINMCLMYQTPIDFFFPELSSDPKELLRENILATTEPDVLIEFLQKAITELTDKAYRR